MLQYPYPIRLTPIWGKTMRQFSERFSSCRTQQEYTQVGIRIFRFFRMEGSNRFPDRRRIPTCEARHGNPIDFPMLQWEFEETPRPHYNRPATRQERSWQTHSWPLKGLCSYYALLGLTQATGSAGDFDMLDRLLTQDMGPAGRPLLFCAWGRAFSRHGRGRPPVPDVAKPADPPAGFRRSR